MRFLIPLVAGAAIAVAAIFLAGGLHFGSTSPAEAGPIRDCLLKLDFNHDGQLNVKDILTFRHAIKTQDLTFDFDNNGTVDIYDVVKVVHEVVACLQQIQPPPTP